MNFANFRLIFAARSKYQQLFRFRRSSPQFQASKIPKLCRNLLTIPFFTIASMSAPLNLKDPLLNSSSAASEAHTHNKDSKGNSKDCLDCLDKEHDLSHKFLIKQSNIVAVESVSRILIQVVSAHLDLHINHRNLIREMMGLMEDSRLATGEYLAMIDSEMISLRSQIDSSSKSIIELETYVESVKRLIEATVETSFLAGAEFASYSLSERLRSAIIELKRVKDETSVLEKQLAELTKEIIIESQSLS